MKHLFRIFVALLWLNGQASATYLGSGPFTMQGLGTAGTPSGGVLSIQGVSGGTVIPFALNATPSLANGNGIVQTQGGSVLSATNGVYTNILQGNAVLATGNPLFITGTGTAGTAATNPITVQGIASMTPLLVNPGTSASWGVSATGSAVPANGFYNTINIGGTLRGWTGINPTGTTYAGQIDVTSIAGTLTATGNGTSGAGDIRVNVASDNTPFTVNAQPLPTTTGGLSLFHVIAAASTNATNIKATPGQVYGGQVYNNSTTRAYLKFYNTSSSPTCGSSTVVKTIMVPASGGSNFSFDLGDAFSTGISFCLTNGIADTDSTSVAATTYAINIDYK